MRELSEREKFAAKEAGAETSIMFRLNYNKKLCTGQYIEFRGNTYVIVSVDGFEYYKRDLTVRAEKVKPEVYDYEEYTEQ